MKAQASMEYLLIVGILLVVLVPLFLFSLNSATTSIRFNEAKEAVETIATEADNLYKFGGGKQTIFVTIPSGVTSSKVNTNSVVLTLDGGDSVAFTTAPLNGSIPTSEGYKQITLEVIVNTVQIS